MLDLEKYPALMTTAQVSEATGLSPKRVRALITSGELPYRYAGRALLIPKSVLPEVFAPELSAALEAAREATA